MVRIRDRTAFVGVSALVLAAVALLALSVVVVKPVGLEEQVTSQQPASQHVIS